MIFHMQFIVPGKNIKYPLDLLGCRPLGERAGDQHPAPISDKPTHFVNAALRIPKAAQRKIGAGSEILQRIQEGSIQIKDYSIKEKILFQIFHLIFWQSKCNAI